MLHARESPRFSPGYVGALSIVCCLLVALPAGALAPALWLADREHFGLSEATQHALVYALLAMSVAGAALVALIVGGACLGRRARDEAHRGRALGAIGAAAVLSVLALMSTAFWTGDGGSGDGGGNGGGDGGGDYNDGGEGGLQTHTRIFLGVAAALSLCCAGVSTFVVRWRAPMHEKVCCVGWLLAVVPGGACLHVYNNNKSRSRCVGVCSRCKLRLR